MWNLLESFMGEERLSESMKREVPKVVGAEAREERWKTAITEVVGEVAEAKHEPVDMVIRWVEQEVLKRNLQNPKAPVNKRVLTEVIEEESEEIEIGEEVKQNWGKRGDYEKTIGNNVVRECDNNDNDELVNTMSINDDNLTGV